MELPRTLHGQLYLLAYDSKQRRFEFDFDETWKTGWRFGFALQSAMLTDLYLSGFIEDLDGRAHRVNSAGHLDPVLDAALTKAPGRRWSEVITNDGRGARVIVRDQLEAAGWINGRERRTFGILPRSRQAVYDVDLIGLLAIRVREALENILDDLPADPRSLAVGLIAVQTQMPAVLGFIRNARHRDALREMTFATIAPILGLYEAIQNRFANMGRSGGGGGCGGGCGGGP